MRRTAKIGLLALSFSVIGVKAGAEDSHSLIPAMTSRTSLSALLGEPLSGAGLDPIPFDEGRLSGMVRRFVSGTLKIDAQLNCMAKVVYHEARDRDLVSQLAVAEVVENRARTDGFPKTVCSVVNQPGQFFPTASYSVPSASDKWRTAVAIARIAQRRTLPSVTSGALFYHAVSSAPRWRLDHRKVAEVGGNIFYR
jgi:N-acetylmuramoyl-L-alanine amidase